MLINIKVILYFVVLLRLLPNYINMQNGTLQFRIFKRLAYVVFVWVT
jgi:hypothetical protein